MEVSANFITFFADFITQLCFNFCDLLFNSYYALKEFHQLGIVNKTDEGKGLQWGPVNMAKEMTGLQLGAVNITKGDVTGVQCGWVNYAENATGLQFGIVNYTQTMKGVQLGVVNIIKENKSFLPVFVIFNFCF